MDGQTGAYQSRMYSKFKFVNAEMLVSQFQHNFRYQLNIQMTENLFAYIISQ